MDNKDSKTCQEITQTILRYEKYSREAINKDATDVYDCYTMMMIKNLWDNYKKKCAK